MGRQPKLIETPKGPMTRRQASQYFNVPIGTIHRRIYNIEKAEDVVRPPEERKQTYLILDGKKVSLSSLGLTKKERNRVKYRLKKGWSHRDAVNLKPFLCVRPKHITPYGMCYLSELSDILDMSKSTLSHRLYKSKWSVKHALNTPIYGRPGYHNILPDKDWYLGCFKTLCKKYMKWIIND